MKRVPPYATWRLDVEEACCPMLAGRSKSKFRPASISCARAMKLFPRNGHARISHPNVERNDLKPDRQTWRTRRAAWQIAYRARAGAAARTISRPRLCQRRCRPGSRICRSKRWSMMRAANWPSINSAISSAAIPSRSTSTSLFKGEKLDGGYGHIELVYDFAAGHEADGWLHGLFRYRRPHRATRRKPVSARMYSTRCSPTKTNRKAMPARRRASARGFSCAWAPQPYDTMCHLIYPASHPGMTTSDTSLDPHLEQGR